MKCHQRKIREEMMEREPRLPPETMDGALVRPVSRSEAESIILVYEWLGTMPNVGLAYYGLFHDGELHGVVCFGRGMGTRANLLCGEENADKAICLERGACVHYAHPHAGSFLVANACKQAAKDFGWRIFYAYSDSEAGEVGTIYQACNWIYIGQGSGRKGVSWRFQYFDPDGKLYSSRTYRAYKKRTGENWEDLEANGWTRKRHMDKGKYVGFYGGDKRERKKLRASLRYDAQPYPKRIEKSGE